MPLRRHPALAALSREHHRALLLARGVQRGASDLRAPTTHADRLDAVLDAFGALLESDVRKEERVLNTGVQDALDETELRALGALLS